MQNKLTARLRMQELSGRIFDGLNEALIMQTVESK